MPYALKEIIMETRELYIIEKNVPVGLKAPVLPVYGDYPKNLTG